MAEQEVIDRAVELGWRPLPADADHPTDKEYKGDPTKFVEADEYVERGERVLPIVREHAKKLEVELKQTQRQLAESLELQKASAEAIEALKTSHEADVQREVEKTRKRVLEEIKSARKEGDVDLEFELRDQLDQLPPKEEAKPKPSASAAQPAPKFAKEFLEWRADNDWYGVDLRKTALADGIAAELRKDAKNSTIEGREFFDMVGQEVEAYLKPAPRGSKVESSRGSSYGKEFNEGGDGKSYSDLPPEAKAQCKADEKNLVGPGRAFKTAAEWQKHYAEQYFR
jgi:hypothetical protein